MIQQYDVFQSDAVILDLEDSVLHYDKDAARNLIKQFRQQMPSTDTDIYVRVNDVNSTFYKEDMAVLETIDIAGYVIPKASISVIQQVVTQTKRPLIVIIESPMAVLEAQDIAKHDQVKALLLGAEDLSREMDLVRTKAGREIAYMREHIALVCHAYKKQAIDTPWVHKEDINGLEVDSKLAKSIGYTAKAVIHPNHVDVINRVFVPSKDEITRAKRILAKADQSGKGAFSLDGQMIDIPIIEQAKQTIKKAQKYNLL